MASTLHNETEPLLPFRHVTSTSNSTLPEPQPPGDFILFCSLLVDSIPGLPFLAAWQDNQPDGT